MGTQPINNYAGIFSISEENNNSMSGNTLEYNGYGVYLDGASHKILSARPYGEQQRSWCFLGTGATGNLIWLNTFLGIDADA